MTTISRCNPCEASGPGLYECPGCGIEFTKPGEQTPTARCFGCGTQAVFVEEVCKRCHGPVRKVIHVLWSEALPNVAVCGRVADSRNRVVGLLLFTLPNADHSRDCTDCTDQLRQWADPSVKFEIPAVLLDFKESADD